jgi:hypothetical protein
VTIYGAEIGQTHVFKDCGRKHEPFDSVLEAAAKLIERLTTGKFFDCFSWGKLSPIIYKK